MLLYSVTILWNEADVVEEYVFPDVDLLFDFVEWLCNYYDVKVLDVSKKECVK